MKPTAGDIRCIALGHITRMAIWQIRSLWDATLPAEKKLAIFREAMNTIATVEKVTKRLEGVKVSELAMIGGLFAGQEERELVDAIAF
jgi:hypothetical protein